MSVPLKVLLVEDHPYSRDILALWLEERFQHVLIASDGLEALELLRAHPDVQVILTDWMMPRMDGLELCRRARSLSRERYLHILVLTARTQSEDLVTALHAGADAFLHKPVDLAELQAQMNVALRIIDLHGQAARRMRELDQARRRVEQDLEAAGRIQRSMLPSGPPPMPGVRFAWAFESSGQVGGDMFGVADLGGRRVGLYALDVCGPGASAALLAVSIGWVMRSALAGRGGGPEGSAPLAPEEVARSLNRRFPVIAWSDQFFSLLYGILDVGDMSFSCVRAGHPPPLRVAAGEITPLAVPLGPLLGVLSDSELEIRSSRHALQPGETVLLYTDGLLRVLGGEDAHAPVSELARFLEPWRGRGVAELVEALRARVQEAREVGLQDDVTVVGFEILAPDLP